jgi:hypothetical protein
LEETVFYAAFDAQAGKKGTQLIADSRLEHEVVRELILEMQYCSGGPARSPAGRDGRPQAPAPDHPRPSPSNVKRGFLITFRAPSLGCPLTADGGPFGALHGLNHLRRIARWYKGTDQSQPEHQPESRVMCSLSTDPDMRLPHH